MSDKPQYRISGALFHRKSNRGPAFSGVIEVEGTKYDIALWEKRSQKGTDYLSISEDKKAEEYRKKKAETEAPSGPKRSEPDDQDIPF